MFLNIEMSYCQYIQWHRRLPRWCLVIIQDEFQYEQIGGSSSKDSTVSSFGYQQYWTGLRSHDRNNFARQRSRWIIGNVNLLRIKPSLIPKNKARGYNTKKTVKHKVLSTTIQVTVERFSDRQIVSVRRIWGENATQGQPFLQIHRSSMRRYRALHVGETS